MGERQVSEAKRKRGQVKVELIITDDDGSEEHVAIAPRDTFTYNTLEHMKKDIEEIDESWRDK